MFGSLLIIPVYLIMGYVVHAVVLPQSVIDLFTSSGENTGFLGGIVYFGNMIGTLFTYFPQHCDPHGHHGYCILIDPSHYVAFCRPYC